MAACDAHLELANRFQTTLSTLSEDVETHAEWVATIAFYKAVHVIEALFDLTLGEHSNDHGDRRERLRSDRRFNKIFKSFARLDEASRIARYLSSTGGGRTYRRFHDYLRPDDVRKELIQHLGRVESSALKQLGDKGASLVTSFREAGGS